MQHVRLSFIGKITWFCPCLTPVLSASYRYGRDTKPIEEGGCKKREELLASMRYADDAIRSLRAFPMVEKWWQQEGERVKKIV